MPISPIYQRGTISLTNGSKIVTGVDTNWLSTDIRPGDILRVGSAFHFVESRDGLTQLTLDTEFAGTTGTDLSYSILRMSGDWGSNRFLAIQVAEYVRNFHADTLTNEALTAALAQIEDALALITTTQFMETAGIPDGATGNVGDWAIDPETGEVWKKTGVSTWTAKGNFKGTIGADGATIHIVTGTPGSGLGKDGDIAIHEDDSEMFQKQDGAWVSIGYFVGSVPEAEAARDAAIVAKTAAETARTGAETAKTAAETARTGAETAKTAAETAKSAAETASTTAVAAASAAADDADATAADRVAVEAAASSAADDAAAAAASKTAAETAETNAAASATAAAASKTAAETAETNAETAEANAAASASDAAASAAAAAASALEAENAAGGGVLSFNTRAGHVTSADGDYTADQVTETSTRKFATPGEKTKLGFISVTQAVDLDDIETKANAAGYAAQVAAATSQSGVTNTDVFLMLSEAGALFKNTWSGIRAQLMANFGSILQNRSEKTTLVDGDWLAVADSESSNTTVRSTLASVWAYIQGKAGLGTAAQKNVGTASGNIPVLDGSGKLDAAVLPAVAITDTFEVASEAAMLALTAEKGDVAVRSDLNKSFILKTNSPSTLADWVELRTPTDAVLSVAGLVGAITGSALKTALSLVIGDITDISANGRSLLQAADYAAMKVLLGLNNVDNTSDATKNSATATLTNKRFTPRTVSITSSATPTANTDTTDIVSITALAVAITSMTTNLTGTPVFGDVLIYKIKDNGTSRAITWGAKFANKGDTLPATTVAGKEMTVALQWNGSVWGCLAVVTEA